MGSVPVVRKPQFVRGALHADTRESAAPCAKRNFRGDGHYGREEAMTWCENYGIDYIFGLSGNVVLDRLVDAAADDIR
jgi:hypothetical protein